MGIRDSFTSDTNGQVEDTVGTLLHSSQYLGTGQRGYTFLADTTEAVEVREYSLPTDRTGTVEVRKGTLLHS